MQALVKVAIVAIVLQGNTSPAQERQRTEQARPSQVEEIVVTARKREETYLEVPVVSTVVTQDVLQRTKTDDLYALATRVPNLVLGNSINSVGTQVSLRGVGTTALNATMDQSISLNIDGLPMTQGWAYGVAMFDVGQIEILKGPQALFFGKNNTGGVISVSTADPTDAVEVVARAAYEVEADEKVVDLILSGPLTKSLRLRLAARYSDEEGFFRNNAEAFPDSGNVTPTSDRAPAENRIVRGTAIFEPNERFSARLKINYNNYRRDGVSAPLQIGYCPEGTGAVFPVAGIAFMQGDDCALNEVYRLAWYDPAAFPAGLPNNGVLFEDSEQSFGTLDLNFQLSDGLALTSVTGYYSNDLDMLFAGSTSGNIIAGAAEIPFESRQFTQELRLTSNMDSQVNFMLGSFYQEGEQRNEVRFVGNAQLALPPVLQHVVYDIDIRSTSLFGQAMWDITPELELAAGARWTDEEREQVQTNLNPAQGPIGPVPRPDPEIGASNVSPEVTLTYKPSDDLTAFAAYRTGFKSGSFNTSTFTPPNRRNSFDDEEASGGEVGIKTRMLDGRLTFNGAAYYYEYDKMQVGAHETEDVGGGNFVIILRTINAATSTVKGVEFDLSYAPAALEGLNLTAAVNYNRARYDSFPNAPCSNGQTISEGCDQVFNPATGRFTSQDLSGRRLVKAPEWSGFVGFDHQIPVGSDMLLAFGAGANYTSKYSTTLVDRPGFEQDAFVKVDANIALTGQDDRWELALIGSNLGNELTSGFCANSNVQNGTIFGGQIAGAETGGPAGDDEAACFVERGREVWGRFTWRFL